MDIDDLILSNRQLPKKVALSFILLNSIPQCHAEDLLGECSLALVIAANRYKDIGCDFRNFASSVMRNKMRDYLKKLKLNSKLKMPKMAKSGSAYRRFQYAQNRKREGFRKSSLDIPAFKRCLLAEYGFFV